MAMAPRSTEQTVKWQMLFQKQLKQSNRKIIKWVRCSLGDDDAKRNETQCNRICHYIFVFVSLSLILHCNIEFACQSWRNLPFCSINTTTKSNIGWLPVQKDMNMFVSDATHLFQSYLLPNSIIYLFFFRGSFFFFDRNRIEQINYRIKTLFWLCDNWR